ncbi:hypothetical protein EDB86DRAFT_3082708 [Lactarius hatsudake]|nr:hypothetical protein EDB86DRAFT_3082708 [Lactarius hatsudake]
MSRYAILRSFIEEDTAAIEQAEDYENTAVVERAEEDYQESEDIDAPYRELEEAIAKDTRRYERELEAEQFRTADYYRENPDALSWAIFRRHQEQHPEEYEHIRYDNPAEEDPRAEEYEDELAEETRAVELTEDTADEPAEEEDHTEDADYGNASPTASTADDEKRSESGLAGMPPMFDGDCAIAARFLDDWDEWSSTLSVQFSQFQLCAIFLALFRPPVDHWAEQCLLQIRQWRDEGMEDDDDNLLEDIIGRFMQEFVPRDDAREENVHAAEDPEDPDDWATVDDEDSTDDGEVPQLPSLCCDDSQDSEEEPGEAGEQYGWQDDLDEYYQLDNAPDEAVEQYIDYGKVPLPYDAERDYADAILSRARTHLEERVHPTPRTQKKRKTRAVNKKRTVKRPKAKSPPTWEARYIRRFGKRRLQAQRRLGVPDYLLEAELLPVKKKTLQVHDYDDGRFHNEWTGPETFNRPAAQPASWSGPDTFATPAYQAAPPDPTPASWGNPDIDAAQEAQAAENTGWFAYQNTDNAMDLGRMHMRARAKCHHCWQHGHTRRNCPNRDSPRVRHWMADYNNDCEDSMPQAVPPRAAYRPPQADPPRADPPRGRSPTVKPVYGSNVATYAPTTRYEPTVITVPETQRREPTPSPSPISDVGFKSIQHHIISTDDGDFKVPLLTPEELAAQLEDIHINAIDAANNGEYQQSWNLCERARMLDLANRSQPRPQQTTMEHLFAVANRLQQDMERYKQKKWLHQQGQLQKLEDQIGEALIIGDDEEAQELDDKAIRLAKILAATDEDRDPAFPITDADVLIQRGRCSRREGNVTFSPSTDPRTPLAKTPNTVGRHMHTRFAEDGTTTMEVMGTSLSAKSHDSNHVIIRGNQIVELRT